MKSVCKVEEKRVSSLVLGKIKVKEGSVVGNTVEESADESKAVSTYLGSG